MENKIFKMDLMKEKSFDENIKATFAFDIQKEAHEFTQQLIYTQIALGNIGYNMTALFMEGLNILKLKYPDIPNDKPLQRRYYRGGKQKDKGQIVRTSIISTVGNKNWIDNYILSKTLTDLFFSKTDFINDLLEELKLKYKGKIKKIPNYKEE